MPSLEEQLDTLAGNKYFTTVDFMSGYYQIPIDEKSKRLTAFVTTEGQYEFNKMPFGLVNAPNVFNKLMQHVVQRIGPNIVVTYMDDVLIPSATVAEGIEKLQKVFRVLWELGLTLKLSKCKFLYTRLDYLGFEISSEGARPGKKKTEAVKNFETPTNAHEVRQFLGLCGFFRKFVEGFSLIARPLTELTKKDRTFEWTEHQEQAFQILKDGLVQPPILALYNRQAELEVHTDACKDGIAGMLLQKNERGVLQPLAYYSRKTTELEAKYHSYELEALAVVETIDRYRVYLLGRHFTVGTDCNLLKTIMTKKDMTPRIGRWYLKLQEYDFTIIHRSGQRMSHIDALSRHPNEPGKEPEEADLKIYSLRFNGADWLLTMQIQDERLKQIYQILKGGRRDTTEEKQINADYVIEENRICRKTEDGLKWVVPKGVISRVLEESHDRMGHGALCMV